MPELRLPPGFVKAGEAVFNLHAMESVLLCKDGTVVLIPLNARKLDEYVLTDEAAAEFLAALHGDPARTEPVREPVLTTVGSTHCPHGNPVNLYCTLCNPPIKQSSVGPWEEHE